MEKKFFSLYKNEIRIHHSTSIKDEFMKLDPNGLNVTGIVKDIYDDRAAYIDSNGAIHVKGTKVENEEEPAPPTITDPPAGDADGLLYRFGFLADVHIDGDGDDESKSASDFKNAIAFLNAEGVAFTSIAGDIGRDGRSSDYKLVKEYFALANHPIYTVKGNHDNYQSSDSSTSGYKSATGCEDDFIKTYGNDVFIYVSMESKDYSVAGLSYEKVDWVKQQLSTYKGKRIFFIHHMFINDTCGNNGKTYSSSMNNSSTRVQNFVAAIKAETKLIHLSGHSHFLFNVTNSYANNNYYYKSGGPHYIHAPSNTRPRDASANTVYEKGEGYVVDVYADKVIFRGFDSTTKAYKTNYVYTVNLAQ